MSEQDEIKVKIEDFERQLKERVIAQKAGEQNSLYVFAEVERLFALLKSNKPNDRSEADRCWAIAVTDMQKLVAFFKVYVVGG